MNYDELKAAINIQNLLYWVTHHGVKLDDTTNMAANNHSIERGIHRGDINGVFGGRGDEADGTETLAND